MPKTKTKKTKDKYEFKDLEKVSQKLNTLYRQRSDLEFELEQAKIKIEEENIGKEIKLVQREISKGQSIHDAIDTYLNNKVFDSNGDLKKKGG